MYNTNQRQYGSWAEFLKDVAAFSEDFDYDKSFNMKNFSYFKKDGQQVMAGTFAGYMQSLKNELGLKIVPEGCFDSGFLTIVLFEDYAKEITEANKKSSKLSKEKVLSEKTNPELLALAKEMGLDAKANMSKKTLVELILSKE